MARQEVLIYLADTDLAQLLEQDALRPAGFDVTIVAERAVAEMLSQAQSQAVVILGEDLPDIEGAPPLNGIELAASLLKINPGLTIVFIPNRHSDELVVRAFRSGVADYISPPVRPGDVLQSITRALQHRQRMDEWTRLEIRRNTKSLQQRVENLESLQRVSHTITASLDLDVVLTAVVDAAVELTGAEEGSLLLLDETTGELYMRAARNFREDFVRTFRIPVNDTLAGEVIRTGRPYLLDEKTPRKIKTSYLVHNLMYVPLLLKDRVIGVLGVDNRVSSPPFSEVHLPLVSTLAGYAAVAIENAHLFSRSELDRSKFETILTRINDGVIVVDPNGRLVLINQAVRDTFEIIDEHFTGKPLADVFSNIDLLEMLNVDHPPSAFRSELALDDGRVFNAQVTPIPEVGRVLTLHDITHLKELDRIKSDFVATVSHDLRSPLTAILGYVELIDRVGPVNAQQKEFIRRVGASVQNITALINDLLDLGKIEAGFDAGKEIVPLGALIQYTVEGVSGRAREKNQNLLVEVAADLPPVVGNPVRLRQMLSNLLGNAVKYTQNGGRVRLVAHAEAGQIILQVSDNGPGIPPADQPFIFDKFYRASNVTIDTPGTGLGLAIVKSIVENHHGRIWVVSPPGSGTIFTIVLPVADVDL